MDVENPLPHTKPSSEGDAWQEAERLGIDTSLLLANLSRTPLERIRAHDRAVSLAIALRKAMRERHA